MSALPALLLPLLLLAAGAAASPLVGVTHGPHYLNPLPGLDPPPQGHSCGAGSRWMEDCNWCSCSHDGIAACTLQGCLPGYRQPERMCEEGSWWTAPDGCNTCQCSNGRAACTRKLCRPDSGSSSGHTRPDLPIMCREGSRWMDGCNWCSCSRHGQAACTRKGCPPGFTPPARQCEPGSIWTHSDGCHSCSCRGGRPDCPAMRCLPGYSRVPQR